MAPSPDEVLTWFRKLADGTVSPQEASDYARPWVGERADELEDPDVIEAMDLLWMSDAEHAPGMPMDDRDSFREWADEFESKIRARH